MWDGLQTELSLNRFTERLVKLGNGALMHKIDLSHAFRQLKSTVQLNNKEAMGFKILLLYHNIIHTFQSIT